MECAALCMLAATVGFVPSSDTHRCSYCVEARSTYSDCFDDVIECAYRDPSSLIFCLNVYEHATPSMVHYSARCLSYEKFYVPDDTIKKIGANGMCKFADVQSCECDVCKTQTTTTVSTTTVLKRHRHHHNHHRHFNESTHLTTTPEIYLTSSSHGQHSIYRKEYRNFSSKSQAAVQKSFAFAMSMYISIFLSKLH